MRRPRNLTDEERALWDSVAKQAKPLRKAARDVKPPAVAAPAKAAKKPAPIAMPTPAPAPAKSTVKKSVPTTVGIERRERSRLARGNRNIDARLDLHGMTQARAHRALLSFLQRAQSDGCRYVLVITGKGKISAEGSERGVLRRQVPEWFGLVEFRMLVTGYEEAAIGHGGAGALYVRVRRGQITE